MTLHSPGYWCGLQGSATFLVGPEMRLRWEEREPLLGLEQEPGVWHLVLEVSGSISHLLGSRGVLNPHHGSWSHSK